MLKNLTIEYIRHIFVYRLFEKPANMAKLKYIQSHSPLNSHFEPHESLIKKYKRLFKYYQLKM